MSTILSFITDHPGTVVSWLILLAVVAYLAVALVLALWAEREEQQQSARLTRIMQAQAQHESQVWPHQGKKGFEQGQGRR